MAKRSNGFDKDPERARLAGKKSSRALPPELKEARLMFQKDLEAMIYKYTQYDKQQLRDLANNPTTPAKDMIVIKLLQMSIDKGDHQRFDFLLNRTIGKVKEQIDHTVTTKPSILVKTDGSEVHFVNEEKEE